MTAPSDDIPTLRFSTDEVPERDRLAVTREVVGRSLARADFEPVPDVPFRYRCVARVLPGLAVASSSLSRLICRRTGGYLADGNDDVVLSITAGGSRLLHLGREFVETSSHACLISTADALVVTAVSVPQSPSHRVAAANIGARGPRSRGRFPAAHPSEQRSFAAAHRLCAPP